jgi:hypothetical protein
MVTHTLSRFFALARIISARLLRAAEEYGSSLSSLPLLLRLSHRSLSMMGLLVLSPGNWSRFSCSSSPSPLSSNVSWLSKPGQFSKSSLSILEASLARRWFCGFQLLGEVLRMPFWMVGDDASRSSREGACLGDAPESPMFRSVEREDCADSAGDFVCCEVRRRFCGAKANLT